MADFFINIPDSGSPNWKAPVSTASLLPTTANAIGDVRIALDTGIVYYWNGTSWVILVTPTPATGITGLLGDVTATGPGNVVATVVSVGGQSAGNIAAATVAALGATSSNTPFTIVKRDVAGNFAAGTITANLIGNVTGNVSGSSASFTGSLAGDVTGTQSATIITAPTVTGKVLAGLVTGVNTPILSTDTVLQAFEKLQAQTAASAASGITQLTGDGTAIGPGITTFTLATVNPDVGTFGNSTDVASFTVNGKGLITTASNIPINFPVVTVTGSGNIASSGGANPDITFTGVLPSSNGGTGVNNSFNLTISGTSHINGTFSGTSSGTNTGDVTLGTANGLSLAGQVLSLQLADATHTGALSTTDWNTFNSKQNGISFAESIVNTGGIVTLVNDTATPGASKYYGTDGSSTLGYYAVPTAEFAIGQLTGDVLSGPATTPSESLPATIASIQGTTVSGTTGTGNVVFSASPTISGVLSAATITASGPVTGSNLSGTNTGNVTLGTANGLSLAGQVLSLALFTSSTAGATPASGGGTTNFLRADGTFAMPPGFGGTVTSVALADGSTTPIYSISGSPVTSSGTLTFTLANQAANTVFAGPSSAGPSQPTFRALVSADIPNLSATYVTQTEVGAANGVASLDSSGKVPISQLPGSVLQYQGIWNPATNTPTLQDSTGTAGYVYWISTAFAGPIAGLNNSSMYNFQIGDLVLYNGTQWELTTPAAGVQSVNGAQGAVIVNAINQLTGDVTTTAASGSQSKVATLVATSNSTLTTLSALTTATSLTIGGSQVTGFTPGSVIFAGSSGQLFQDNSKFFWNDTNFALGIGVQPDSTNAVIDVVNNSGSTKAIQTTGYGATVPFRGRYANGTLASPTAATTGNALATFSGRGYGASQFAAASTGFISMVAAATFTNTSNPTYMTFNVTPTGSVTAAEAMRIAPTGDILIGTTTDNGSTFQVAGTSTFSSTVTSVSLQSQMGAWSALGFA